MPALTITKTYLNGNILTQTDLDNAFNSISTLLNTTLLDSTNIQTGGIVGTNLANSTITSAYLAAGSVGTAQISSSAVTAAKMEVNINLPGTTVQESGKNVVVSNTNSTTSLAVVRGVVSDTGSVTAGEGFSVSKPLPGTYILSFSNPFSDSPAVTANAINNGGGTAGIALVHFLNSTGIGIDTVTFAGAYIDSFFTFSAVGQRV